MRQALAIFFAVSALMPASASAYGRVHATDFETSDRWGTNFGKHFDDEVKAQKRAKAPPKNKPKRSRNYEPPAGGEAP